MIILFHRKLALQWLVTPATKGFVFLVVKYSSYFPVSVFVIRGVMGGAIFYKYMHCFTTVLPKLLISVFKSCNSLLIMEVMERSGFD